ncbi:hypothetical protein [Aureimonas altamirensis]|jgi:hypothetical protein|uniref:Uncharacterized protein n=1 Tax=Aureimonas altamirensis DSM 21988 TaxID=1121026 RepID=A0ABY1IDR3_9HYPH|nr:hypothetical protein [Aureimonas altamirensis]SHJ02918.1 hypothetical protein SAMN02745911_1449 [Aureimonas altamirensis DSM 21988]
MRAVLRFLFVIPLGFVFACYGAAFALLWPFIEVPATIGDDPFRMVEMFFVFTAQAAQVGSAALLPWAIFMLVTEIMGWRSLLLHAAIGLASGFVALRLAYEGAMPPISIQTAIFLAGLAFGMIYWIIAGRAAGLWRRRASPPVD